jgi:hypothetical protein
MSLTFTVLGAAAAALLGLSLAILL